MLYRRTAREGENSGGGSARRAAGIFQGRGGGGLISGVALTWWECMLAGQGEAGDSGLLTARGASVCALLIPMYSVNAYFGKRSKHLSRRIVVDFFFYFGGKRGYIFGFKVMQAYV